ncbi:NBS-LRR type disease resistance protein [Medicago truncatula]|uniref:NBS-LRR type disease resistance protein n=1 Tax=Medicago truncatula TaxID=3880 RepID=A0A072VJY8_MEDTR|nr:NBS-LRR type disease resistance protein [Medicago truncatula]KEH38446.1 NBS-LRR type disease resistance protein [Medicago truncatula]
MKFNKESIEGRATQLRNRLTKEKSILVILDDIWGRLDLVEVGIPFGDDHKGCKLVVTSRDLNVLNCEMNIQKAFRIDVLHQEDSWKLFEKMAGLCEHLHTLTEARNQFFNLINDLRASSLLLERERGRVRMHDVVRDVAKSIASRFHPTYSMKKYSEVKQWPTIDQLQKFHQIILPWSYINELPEKLECPELRLLLLHNIGDNLKVSDEFFSGMRALTVLDLYGMMLTPSPAPSLSFLTNLQTLILAGCELEDISIVLELKSLEILSLERSVIIQLPEEIGQLSNLRMLNLTNCSRLRFIPANLISSLTCLEELYMGNCFIQWDVKRSKDESNNASLEELSNLSHLKTLDIMIQDSSVWPRDLHVFAKLERYNIFIGDMWKWSLEWAGGASESSRTLKLAESKSTSILSDYGFNLLLKSAEDLCLAQLQRARGVLYELNMEGFPQLMHLCIEDSSELECIVNSIVPSQKFSQVEALTLDIRKQQ